MGYFGVVHGVWNTSLVKRGWLVSGTPVWLTVV